MITAPLISVIIPAYNAGQFITETLDSIVANNYPNLQIIVVDDGSTDDTAKKARIHPASVTLIQQSNQGLSKALNTGLKHVHGEMIAFLDADDIWTPNKLNIQVALMDDADIVMGQMSLMINQQFEMFRASLSTALFRKTVFDHVGEFSDDLEFAMDHDLFFKAREAGFRIVKHNDVVHRHRRHNENMSNDQITGRHYEMIALKRSLDRRRKSGQMTVPRFDANTVHKDESPMNKLVSVMIPVYNGVDFIGQAIDSVLNQDYQPIEIIVVNDGSTDRTSDVLDQYKDKIKVVNQPNQGLGVARQSATAYATGQYFALLDCDDRWTPNAVRLRVEALEANPNIQIVFGYQQYFFDEQIDEVLKQRLRSRYEQTPIPAEVGPTAIFTRETFEQVGKFTDSRTVHPFLDWYSRAKEQGLQSLMLPDLILHRRIHNHNNSRLRANSILPGTLKQMLDRRRKLHE